MSSEAGHCTACFSLSHTSSGCSKGIISVLKSISIEVLAQKKTVSIEFWMVWSCWNEQWHHHLSGTRAEVVGSPAQALALALAALVACDKGRIFTMVCLIPRASRATRKNRYKEVKWCRRKFRVISHKAFILRSYVYWFSWQEKRRSYNTEHLHTKITLEQRLDQTQPMDCFCK